MPRVHAINRYKERSFHGLTRQSFCPWLLFGCLTMPGPGPGTLPGITGYPGGGIALAFLCQGYRRFFFLDIHLSR